MPKYLVQGAYTEQALSGLLKTGGSKRRSMVEQLAKEMGGELEAFYFYFGSDDFVIVLDLPGNLDMAATSTVAQANGTVKSRVTILMTQRMSTRLCEGKSISVHRNRSLATLALEWSTVRKGARRTSLASP